jgi:ADP-heptose:LPS heptosyltransferase
MLITPEKKHKILLVQTGRIGDLILLFPAFEALKKLNPNNELHLLASRHNYQAALHQPFVDKVFVYEKGLKLFGTVRKLRKEKYDIWIDPKDHKSGESRLLALLCGAAFKIGFDKNKAVYHHLLESEELHPYEHMTYINLLALQPFGIKPAITRPNLFVEKTAETKLQTFLQNHHLTNYYCINLSGSQADRTWQTEKWIAFLQNLPTPHPVFVIIASPAETERAKEIVSQIENAVYFETKSIVEVFSVVANSTLVITPDTSIVHIATAFDKPLLALYVNLPRFYKKFYPLNTIFEVVMEDKEGTAVSEISVDKLLNAYNKIYKRMSN